MLFDTSSALSFEELLKNKQHQFPRKLYYNFHVVMTILVFIITVCANWKHSMLW